MKKQKVTQLNLNRIDLQQKYNDDYKKIIVTYHDGSTRDFTPDEWFYFEKNVRKMAKKIKFIDKKRPLWISTQINKLLKKI